MYYANFIITQIEIAYQASIEGNDTNIEARMVLFIPNGRSEDEAIKEVEKVLFIYEVNLDVDIDVVQTG